MINNISKEHTAPIHLIPSFHYDVIYLKSYKEYLEISLDIIDKALDILSDDADYVFTMEQVILLEEFWNSRPEKQQLLKKFVQEGRFDISPAMYVMPDMNLIDGESMFMQAKIGKDWIKKHLGIEQESCWIADCWGHHSQLPQILTQSGYNYYFFWRCMRRDVMKNEFVWKGIDGSEIKTHWLATGYANLHFPDTNKIENALELGIAGVTPDDINSLYNTSMQYGPSDAILMCNGGDFTYPQPTAPEVTRNLNSTGKIPQIKFSTPTKFMNSINWNNVNTFEGEFNSAFQGTFTSNIKIKQYNQYFCNKLNAIEKLCVLTNTRLELLPIWKLLLKQQFHDTICGTIADSGLQETYEDFKHIEKLINEKFEQLGAGKETESFFNPLSSDRTEFITTKGKLYKATIPALQKKNLEEMEEIDNTSQAINLPCVFNNEFYSVKINEQAYITSLIEKNSNQQFIASNACPFGALALQMDYGDLWLNFEGPLSGGSLEASLTQNNPDPLDRGKPEDIVYRNTIYPIIKQAQVITSNEGITIKQRGLLDYWEIKIEFETEIKLSSISPVIKFNTKFIPSGKNYRIRAAFPTSIDNGKISHEIPFGIQERGEHEHPAQSWINYSTNNIGAALFSSGIPANNVDNGVMLLTLFRAVAMEYKTASKDSFNEGVPHEFKYAFMPHSNVPISQIINKAHAFSNPLVPVCDNSFINEFKLTGSDNVQVSAIRWSDDKIFIRLYEATGMPTLIKLKIPKGVSKYFEADGLENKASSSKTIASDEIIDITFKPFEIKSFLLQIIKDQR